VLFVSWILDGLCPDVRPHPLLYLAGEPGSAKTTAAMIARNFVDPNEVPLRSLPTTVRDLFVAANGSRALAFDNISQITGTISDALCQIASGSGYGTRKLFSDTGQILVGGSRPVILNGLLNAIDRSDLADRAVLLPMTRIGKEERRSESEIWKSFEDQRSQIFGALLDCVACGLRQLPHVRLSRMPRMADFARWSVATEAFQKGVFMSAFESAAEEANDAVAENDPVVVAIAAFMMDRPDWTGTTAGLLHELSTRDRSEAAPSRSKTWPTEASAFGKRLRLASPVLRKMGIGIGFGKAPDRSRTRTISLRRVEPSDTSDTSDTSDGSTPSDRPSPIPVS
jgi:hypothetical protein